ncbi:DUF2254 domain-containing protein [Nocardioides sp. Y6]|uniref:DUF2254 domain-containing protein n=1 Tax=Nocardioides malaquae TaxID=2773426 RepID=A0ABR9RVI2_9ACTN|nr:DUF2254 domain-containing protein [Nocardioides malaquae]MBE7325172.1 DUF2254 domain-containing protein [Nocardioides malaquae]
MTRWLDALQQFTRGIWFRATVYTLAAVLLCVLAWVVSHFLPDRLAVELGQDSVSQILSILASSMLAVTTFSLTTMVSAYSSAASAGTPRSTQLFLADRTSQNALSTFVGAFAFSVVGIVALSLGVYSETGRTVLFVGSILVVVAVLVSLLRWIGFLTVFGRMADVIDRVEKAATEAMQEYCRSPRLGAARWVDPPAEASGVCADIPGYVVRLDAARLQQVAAEEGVTVWVHARAGARVSRVTSLLSTSEPVSDAAAERLRRAFVIAHHRSFDQDPRLGLISLSEISSKGLSPGINDPGTAVEVLSALQRVLHVAQQVDGEAEVEHDRVHLAEIDLDDFVVDAFRPTARDGAAVVEVAVRLQKEIATLVASAPGPEWRTALVAAAAEALQRAEAALDLVADRDEVHRAYALATAPRT